MTLRHRDDARPPLTAARYQDGTPVVFGPFGGDDLTPIERRLRAFGQAYQSRSWWCKLLNLDLPEKTRREIDARYPRPTA